MPAPSGIVSFNNDNATWEPGYDAVSDVLDERIGYRLGVRAVAGSSSYQQVVRMSAQTDSTTDLIKWWNGYRLEDIARGEILTDLSSAWDSALERGWVTPELRESFSYQGKAYGIPLYKSFYAMFYSKQTFEKHGLGVPATFDELMHTARTLSAAGVTPIHSAGASSWESIIWFQQLVGGVDPHFYQALTNNEAGFDDEPAREAMDMWSQMYAEGLFSAPDADPQSVPGRFAEGSLGMALSATWSANSFTSAGLTDDDVGVFMVPNVNPSSDQAIFVESGSLCVPMNAHKRDAALAVATEWLATDVQQAWVDFLGDSSANPAAQSPVGYVRDVAQTVLDEKPLQLTRYWEASPPALVEGNAKDLGEFMVNPTPANGRATLGSMQRRAEKEWKVWLS